MGPSARVKEKADRLAASGAVRDFTVLVEMARTEIGPMKMGAVRRELPSGEFLVEGDHGTYQVTLKPWSGEVRCSCPWGTHRAAEMHVRPCSHVLAVVRLHLDAEGNLRIEETPEERAEREARQKAALEDAFKLY